MNRQLIEKLEGYVVPDLKVNFVDREVELNKILLHAESPISSIAVLTGPWGCGKTEFMRALVYALSSSELYIPIYISLVEEEFEKAYGFTDKAIASKLEELAVSVLGDRAKIIFNLYRVFKTLTEKVKLRNKNVLLILDEVTKSLNKYAISIRDFIASLSKKLYDVESEFNCKLTPILLTSDQTAIQYFTRELGRNMVLMLMWNLSRDSFEDLLSKISLKWNIKFSSNDVGLLWKLTGGNPRAITEITSLTLREKNTTTSAIEKWIATKIELIVDVLEDYVRSRVSEKSTMSEVLGRLMDQLSELIGDVDHLSLHPIWNYLLNANIVMKVDDRFNKISVISEVDGVGSENAFQTPLYFYILKGQVEMKTLNVKVSDVMSYVEC